jgi:sensor domain CHASE-containing protein
VTTLRWLAVTQMVFVVALWGMWLHSQAVEDAMLSNQLRCVEQNFDFQAQSLQAEIKALTR